MFFLLLKPNQFPVSVSRVSCQVLTITSSWKNICLVHQDWFSVFFPRCAVRNHMKQDLDCMMALSAWSRADPLILTRAFFSVCLEQASGSIIDNHVRTHTFTRTHTHAQTSHHVSKCCSDLTGNGPVVGIPISLWKCLHFDCAACLGSQVPLYRLRYHN